MKNTDSTALVTGASRGIGAAIARALAAQGLHVILVARRQDALEAVARDIRTAGGACSVVPCDLSKSAEIARLWAVLERQFAGLPGILVNNAGLGGPFHRTDEVSEAEWDDIFALNVKAPFLLSQKLLPAMQARRFGRIVNIGSLYGILGGARSSTYAASKHALMGYTKSVAAEWGAWNITCNAVSPGYVDTEMTAAHDAALLAQAPGGQLASAEEIARVVAFLVQQESGYINGANIVVDGGLSAGFRIG